MCKNLGKCSFEDLFQFILRIYSQIRPGAEGLIPKYELPDLEIKYDHELCYSALTEIIGKLYQNVAGKENNTPQWFSDFFNHLTSFNEKSIFFDFLTLNYDIIVDNVLGKYKDGFIKKDCGYMAFDRKEARILREENILNHLHGCCLFNYNPAEESSPQYLIYKYDLPIGSYDGLSISYETQAHETVFHSPIITGLWKTESLTLEPYASYHCNLHQSLINNRVLFIIGYGFGDYYINYQIQYFANEQGNKIVYIDKQNHMKWIDFPEKSN